VFGNAKELRFFEENCSDVNMPIPKMQIAYKELMASASSYFICIGVFGGVYLGLTKNQSGIATDHIQVGDRVIRYQSKFYGDTLLNFHHSNSWLTFPVLQIP